MKKFLFAVVFFALGNNAFSSHNNNNNSDLEMPPLNKAAPKLADQLTLYGALELQAICEALNTDEVGVQMNNAITNLAFDVSLEVGNAPGNAFFNLFQTRIQEMMFGQIESLITKKTGLSVPMNLAKYFTGYSLSGKKQATEIAREYLSDSVLNILRLKFLTDPLNRHVLGPKLVAPYTAYAINQLNLGQAIQKHVYAKFMKTLQECQPELIAKALEEDRQVEQQVIELDLEMLTPGSNQAGLTQKREDLKRDCESNAIALIVAGIRKTDNEELLSKVASFKKKSISLQQMLQDVPFIGKKALTYIQPCPHIESGELGKFLGKIPGVYLNITGVSGNFQLLKNDFEGDKLSAIYDDVIQKYAAAQNKVNDMKQNKFTASEDELEGSGTLNRFFSHCSAAMTGIAKTFVDIENLSDVNPLNPVLNHVTLVRKHAQDLTGAVHLAITPVQIIGKTMSYQLLLSSVNYASSWFGGATIPYTFTISLGAATLDAAYNLYLSK